MRSKFHLAPLALLPRTIAGGATTAKRRGQRRTSASITSSHSKRLIDNTSEESLRERWVNILALENESNSVRLENRQEQKYYYEAEILADKLLGMDTAKSLIQNENGPPKYYNPMLSKLSMVWNAIAIASAAILIGIPIASLFSKILTSNMMQTMISSIQSSITPYLIPTFSMISSSLQNYRLQAQAILHSLPYFLKHIHRIKIRPGPFLYKLMRKCIIIEAWRHIWIRVYKTTRYLWKGTLKNAKSAYTRVMPAWIRRGVKSMFQSMVQAHVQGYVGGALGSVLGGVTFESWVWTSSSGSDGGDSSSSVAESISNNAAQSLGATLQDAVNSVPVEESMDALLTESFVGSAVEDAVQSIIAEDTMDALAESAGSAVEDVVESIAEGVVESCVDNVVDSIAEDTMDALAEGMESFVDDCLSEGCVE